MSDANVTADHACTLRCSHTGAGLAKVKHMADLAWQNGRHSKDNPVQHLTAIDAAFLQMETSQTPMHLASVHMLELPKGYQGNFPEELKRHVQSRLHLAPLLTRKLVNMPLDLANPVWVHDDDVDIDYHVRRLSLPSPGTHAQLMGLVARIHSVIMDRSRPLWEIVLIEGIEGGGYAMVLKLHHAGLDGLAGQRLVEALYDLTPTPRTVEPPPEHKAQVATDTSSLFIASLSNAATQAMRLWFNLPDTMKMVLGMVQGMRPATGEQLLAGDTAPTRGVAKRAEGEQESLGAVQSFLENPKLGIGPPRVSFNTTVTNQRLFAGCSMPIADMKRITQARTCTLNDVVMAVAAGALRRYLRRRGELPDRSLLAMMPVSIRAPDDLEMSNRVSAARCDLHTDIADPLERLAAICASTADIKRNLENTRKGMPTDFPSIGVPWLLPPVVALVGKLHLADRLPPLANVVVSNVALSPKSLYIAGARLASYWPMLILMHGMGLALATHSYAGSMEWGVLGCRQSTPDVNDFAADLQASLSELLAAVTAAPATAPARPALPRPARKRVAREATPRKASRSKVVPDKVVLAKVAPAKAAPDKVALAKARQREAAPPARAAASAPSARPTAARRAKTP